MTPATVKQAAVELTTATADPATAKRRGNGRREAAALPLLKVQVNWEDDDEFQSKIRPQVSL